MKKLDYLKVDLRLYNVVTVIVIFGAGVWSRPSEDSFFTQAKSSVQTSGRAV